LKKVLALFIWCKLCECKKSSLLIKNHILLIAGINRIKSVLITQKVENIQNNLGFYDVYVKILLIV
jgi:hypothetical protein